MSEEISEKTKDSPPVSAQINRRFFGMGLILAAFVFVFDQFSKIALYRFIVPNEWSALEILPVFNIVHTWNYGVSFSLFYAESEVRRWLLVATMSVISAGVVYWLYKATTRLQSIGLGLILGGAAGNICDRLAHGAVFDFLQFHLAGYYWPSFNLADSAIVVGVGFLLLESFVQRHPSR